MRNLVYKITTMFSLAICTYIIYATIWGPYKTTIVHRAIFLGAMLLIYLWSSKPLGSSRLALAIDTVLVSACVASLGYVVIFWKDILGAIGGAFLNPMQLIVGSIIIIASLEAVRRVSWPLLCIALLAVCYTLFGHLIPGELSHAGMSFRRFIYLTAFSHEGIFGLGLAVASTYLFMFMLFSSALQETGASDFFLRFTNALVGKTRGGPAKGAVIASGLTGMMVGSSVGNVVTTGSITIPMMKRSGFKPDTAAAIEVVASEGAQLIPPIMGAGAFLMAELTGIPYWTIAIAAVIPALLYYLSVFIVVDMEAAKRGMTHVPKTEKLGGVLKAGGHNLIPVIVLFFLLLVVHLSPTYAGIVTIFVTIALNFLKRKDRLTLKRFLEIFDKGARSCASITALIAVIGVVQQAFTITGLGPRLSELLVMAAGGQRILILIMAMFIAIILGMGLPTPIAYLISGIFVAPALIGVGFSELSAHLFLFFFAIKSGSTPPIAMVAVVAAGIADSNWMKTAWWSFVYSWPGFIIAFAFMHYPGYLLQGPLTGMAIRLVCGCIGCAGLAYAMQRRYLVNLQLWEVLLMALGALITILSPASYIPVGLVLIGLVVLFQFRKRRLVYGDNVLPYPGS